MVVVVDQLGFVEEQAIGGRLVEEQITVVRHVEHPHKFGAPGIALRA